MRLKPTPERLYKKSKDIESSSLLINDFGIRENDFKWFGRCSRYLYSLNPEDQDTWIID